MRPGLFSISGLAVELGFDRRTIAGKLRNVRPDGILPGGSPGWRLAAALPALNGPRLASNKSEALDPISDFLEARLADPRIVAEGGRMLGTVEETAQMLGVDCETFLLWLQAGAPFASPGDWSDGSGFVVDLSSIVNWIFLIASHLAHVGRHDLHDVLRLPGSTGPTSTKFCSH